MQVKLKFKGKEAVVRDIKRMSAFGKFAGLMFKPQDASALLFEFGKARMAIHSFFCPVFLAIWLSRGKIVDYQIVRPYRISVKPRADYEQLIEVPINEKYASVIKLFYGKSMLSS